MMKIFYTIAIFFIVNQVFAQGEIISDNSITVPVSNRMNMQLRVLHLSNGLTIYLNPDENLPDVYGLFVIKGGAKYDVEGATGTAHFLEHMMFKGSERLGTIDYKMERVYLDSILRAYNLLQYSKDDEKFRNDIFRKINRLSQAAANFAIPNEFNKVLAEMGGTHINATTSYENTIFYNHFPAENMNKWIALQVDRFTNPVFRLFSKELETIYEEKNMALDNPFYNLFREVYKSFYPNSVYGKQSILGSVEDLQNPSVMNLESYYKAHYSANNMALILVGNFNVESVVADIDKTFGILRDGDEQQLPVGREAAFEGRKSVTKRLSPVPVGVLGFRTVPYGHSDRLGLEIIQQLLTNSESTGLIDKLVKEKKLLDAGMISDPHYDIGGSFIYFIPKPFVQSLKSGEKLILAAIDSLREGNFDDKLLKAVLAQKDRQYRTRFEDAASRASLIVDAYMLNRDFSSIILDNELMQSITKKQIMKLARKYYGKNYLAFYSKAGESKPTRLQKPNFAPLNPKNKNVVSEFAKEIGDMESPKVEAHYLHFGEDVKIAEIDQELRLFYTANPFNNVYSLTYRIGMGTYTKPGLDVLAYYLSNVGTEDENFETFRKKLQARGTTLNVHADGSYFYISLKGFDQSLSSDLRDIQYWLKHPEQNEEILKHLLSEEKINYKILKSDIYTQNRYLSHYAMYGKDSPELKRFGKKEIKSLKISDLMNMLTEVLSFGTEVHYVGNLDIHYVKEQLKAYAPLADHLNHSTSPYDLLPRKTNDHEVYFLDNKKALQSHIRINANALTASKSQRFVIPVFNRYYGLGMSSLVFRELREFRALAYGAYAYIRLPYYFSNPSQLNAWMSTSSDKTNDALGVFLNLMDSFPEVHPSIEPYKKAFVNSINSQLPGFRYWSFSVSGWIGQGYQYDPRIDQYNTVLHMPPDEVDYLFGTFIKGQYHRISVVGNSKSFDLDQLKKQGRFFKLKLKDIYNR